MNEQQILEQAEKIVGFKSHVLSYAVINLFLTGLDLYDNAQLDWAFYVFLGWGVGLVSHYISVYNRIFSVEKEA